MSKIDDSILAEKCKTLTTVELAEFFNCAKTLVNRRLKLLGLSSQKPKRTMTPENFKKMRDGLDKWRKENPDQAKWRMKSVPCENVKAFLRSKGISFAWEYKALEDRDYSIDIAFPDKKIGLEINGTQHYKKDGSLSDYHQERHDLLVANGWIIYEIFYKGCFKFDNWGEYIDKILNSPKLEEFDYLSYTPGIGQRSKVDGVLRYNWIQKKPCELCDTLINLDYTYCQKHSKIGHYTLKKLPSPEIIQKELETIPLAQLAKQYKVTRNTLKNFCRFYKIQWPKQKTRPLVRKTGF